MDGDQWCRVPLQRGRRIRKRTLMVSVALRCGAEAGLGNPDLMLWQLCLEAEVIPRAGGSCPAGSREGLCSPVSLKLEIPL